MKDWAASKFQAAVQKEALYCTGSEVAGGYVSFQISLRRRIPVFTLPKRQHQKCSSPLRFTHAHQVVFAHPRNGGRGVRSKKKKLGGAVITTVMGGGAVITLLARSKSRLDFFARLLRSQRLLLQV